MQQWVTRSLKAMKADGIWYLVEDYCSQPALVLGNRHGGKLGRNLHPGGRGGQGSGWHHPKCPTDSTDHGVKKEQ
jgi:hypothetical protein